MHHRRRTPHPQAYIHMLIFVAILLAAAAGASPRSAAAAPAPLALEFNGSDNPASLSSFLATMLPGTNVPNGGATVDTAAPGKLHVVSSAGDLSPFGAGQDNALAIQYDSSGSYTIGARLLKPAFTTPFQSAGIFIGKTNTQYIRFTAGKGSKGSNGERLELDVLESNGKLRSAVIALAPGTFASINNSLDLFLSLDHTGSGRLTALYRIDSDDPNAGRLATTRNFPRWLRQGNAVPVSAGVITTNRGAFSPMAIDFDWLRVTNAPQVVASVAGTKTVDKDGVNGPPVNPGDTLTYTVSVTNNGGVSTSVQIADPIPVDTSYVAGSATGGATFDAAYNRIVWQNAALAGGATASFTYQAKINLPPLQSSTIVNTAALTYGASAVPALLSAATTVGITPDLSDSTYTASPALVGPNGAVTYTLNLRNGGTADANGATVELAIPSGTTLVANSASASSGSVSVDPSLTKITWSAAGPLAIDGVVTITFAANVGNGFANGATISSQAIIQATGILPTVVAAQSIYTVAAAVAGTKTVDKTAANPGEALTYLITVTNTSGAAANDVQVVDPIPQDTTFLGSLSASAGAPTFDSGSNQVIWQIPTLAAGQSVTMSFQVQINPLPLHSATITNKALLSVPGAPQSLLTASTSVLGVADLGDSIYSADPLTVGPNGTVTYALNLLSTGNSPASNASVTLTIPSGTSLVANSATATSGSLNVNTALNTIVWTASNPLSIGSVTRISFQVRLGATITNSVLTSTATIQADTLVPNVKIAQASFSQSAPSTTYLYLAVLQR